MENALALDGGQTMMMWITVFITVFGLVALAAAVFMKTRWRLKYSMEFLFIAILLGLAWLGDWSSTSTFAAYQEKLPAEAVSGKEVTQSEEFFDRTLTVVAFQWGFAFITGDNEISRNAAVVKPGEKVLFKVISNDVIHGFQIPVASITAEIDPQEVRQLWIRAPDTPGQYLIQCVNYCGVGHAQMKAWLVVEGDEEDKTAGMKAGGNNNGA
jgi:heme/copper-type cytochrome/quinol oxidase subunit 2